MEVGFHAISTRVTPRTDGVVVVSGMKRFGLTVVLLTALGGCSQSPIVPGLNRSEPDGTLVLAPIGRLGLGPGKPGAGKENSGMVRSRRDPTVFWTLNDSGDEPRVYPVRADGTSLASVREPESPGTVIGGAINGDWEAIGLDASGRLVVADVGNNSNARADLTIYLVEEPEPTESRTTFTRKFLVRYPEQRSRPAPRLDFNYDAEGVFTVGDEIYILTKHRSDTKTRLYRVSGRDQGVVNDLELLETFDVEGQVTGADCLEDGMRLAVLTYDRIWIFERESAGDTFFSGRRWSRAYRYLDGVSDSESVCFEDEGTLLIADESRGVVSRVRVEEIKDGRAGVWPQ
jgi:hypothetical protein